LLLRGSTGSDQELPWLSARAILWAPDAQQHLIFHRPAASFQPGAQRISGKGPSVGSAVMTGPAERLPDLPKDVPYVAPGWLVPDIEPTVWFHHPARAFQRLSRIVTVASSVSRNARDCELFFSAMAFSPRPEEASTPAVHEPHRLPSFCARRFLVHSCRHCTPQCSWSQYRPNASQAHRPSGESSHWPDRRSFSRALEITGGRIPLVHHGTRCLPLPATVCRLGHFRV